MNKKGMTLMEVLVSLVLISIVMIFVVNLLSDLKNEGILSNKRNADSLTRASLINVIQGDLINNENYLTTFIKNCDQGFESNLNINTCYQFKFKDETVKNLYINQNFIAYGPSGAMEKWDLNYGTYDVQNITVSYVGQSSKKNVPSLLTIHIPVNGVDSTAKNKFDIELTALSSTGRFTCQVCSSDTNCQECDSL